MDGRTSAPSGRGIWRSAGASWRDRSAGWWVEAVLLALAVGWCAMRFIGAARVPAGLHTDEALAGLQAACLAETGATVDGRPWPLFAQGLGGGLYTPTYLYSLYAWTRLFGVGPAALRGFPAFLSVLGVLGVGLLAWRVAGGRAARLAMVAAALSPWSFQLARLATDGPMAPVLLVWGVYLFLRSPHPGWAGAGGAVMALAAITYPPARVQVPLVTLLLLSVERRRLSPGRLGAFLGAMVMAGVPLFLKLAKGELLERSKALSILTDGYIREHRGELGRVTFVVKQTLDNLFQHLRPSYLFFTGDPNHRHSTQVMGELGWLDIFALGAFILTLGAAVAGAFRVKPPPAAPLPRIWLVPIAAVFGGAAGTLPAALCWEGLPHALRSMGAWPAVALFTGASLTAVWTRFRIVPALALVLAIGQTVHFVPHYFRHYGTKSFEWWDGELSAAARSRDPVRFATEARRYSPLQFRYFLMVEFGDTCVSSREHAERIVNGGL